MFPSGPDLIDGRQRSETQRISGGGETLGPRLPKYRVPTRCRYPEEIRSVLYEECSRCPYPVERRPPGFSIQRSEGDQP